jgi:hypothetical protein
MPPRPSGHGGRAGRGPAHAALSPGNFAFAAFSAGLVFPEDPKTG